MAGETFGADAGAGGVEGAVEGAGCEGVDFEAEFGGEGEETWGGHLGGGVGGRWGGGGRYLGVVLVWEWKGGDVCG